MSLLLQSNYSNLARGGLYLEQHSAVHLLTCIMKRKLPGQFNITKKAEVLIDYTCYPVNNKVVVATYSSYSM